MGVGVYGSRVCMGAGVYESRIGVGMRERIDPMDNIIQ